MKTNFEKAESQLIYKVIAGSKAYGLDLPTSDTDIRGIYLQGNEHLLGFGYQEQVNDLKNDIVYYELNRFIRLLNQNNPNIIENLFVPEDKVLINNPIMAPLYRNRHKFLTKKIRNTFGGYAISQIKKARGLNKKVVNPMDKEKKAPIDFCYIYDKADGYMMFARQWLKKHNKAQEYCGLAEMPNGVQQYKLYYDYLGELKNDNPRYADIETHCFKGIIKENSDDIRHSSIPKKHLLEAFLYYNKDGYSSYCKDYKEYWEWVGKRNPHRYNDNARHGKGYDGKNMMHCLRMLDMAIDIANTGTVNLVRPNREWLLSVRRGEEDYDRIMGLIAEKRGLMDEAFDKCNLPEEPDFDMAHNIIMEIRG